MKGPKKSQRSRSSRDVIRVFLAILPLPFALSLTLFPELGDFKLVPLLFVFVFGAIVGTQDVTTIQDNSMSRRPLDDDHIREAAYHLWEEEGRPHGKDQEHWHKAADALSPPKPKAKTARKAPAKPRSAKPKAAAAPKAKAAEKAPAPKPAAKPKEKAATAARKPRTITLDKM